MPSDNAAAGKLKLSESEIAALDNAFPRGPKTAWSADVVAPPCETATMRPPSG